MGKWLHLFAPFMPRVIYAHSLPNRPESRWEPLSDHLAAVGKRAAEFAEAFGWAEAARVAGRLHDIGKCSRSFQEYIARPSNDDEQSRGPDHSTAGAREAFKSYGDKLGKMLAFAVAGHHAGLADAADLKRRLNAAETAVQPYAGWEAECGALPAKNALLPTRTGQRNPETGFTEMFLTRMIFSCLVDADFLETERFYAEANGEQIRRAGHTDLAELRDRLRKHMAKVCTDAEDTPVNALRARVLQYTTSKADFSPGLFTLTVPTGGGKTLASLSFALEHAVHHYLRRVIYVIPYTSIIEQTAEVFRKALDVRDDVLEHHSSFDWEQFRKTTDADSEGPSGLSKLRRAAENWDVPIVVTTAVQFFESLFAKRRSSCRKLHNIARSVIVLDEVQTLPLNLLRPCVSAVDELARNYGSSIVLCTATQPALRKKDVKGGSWGLEIDDGRELAPDPASLYVALKRVTVEQVGEIPDETVVRRFDEREQMLCIVNSRAHARKLFDSIENLPGSFHLTTLMCPGHRRTVLEKIRERLKTKQPVRLVATSLIEAGVDVDFPEVWRAATGLDSIAQAAGRCNREGKLDCGRTVIFVPAEMNPPHALKLVWQAARPIIRRFASDILSPDAVREYFNELYWQRGDDALDAAKVDDLPGILVAIRVRATDCDFPFEGIARAFRMIDDTMEPVVVPWATVGDGSDAAKLLGKIGAMPRPLNDDLRRLQQYVVSIPRKLRDEWFSAGVLGPVHPRLGPGLLAFPDLAHYRPQTGLDIFATAERNAEFNIIS